MHPPDAPHIRVDCNIPHIDNCVGCLGFGVYAGKLETVPVSASEAIEKRFPHGEPIPCPVCRSTVAGLPSLSTGAT